MKKFVFMIIVALSCLMMTSCATSMAAETSVATTIEYYDYLNGYIVVYIDGIPSYRFWDATYSRYYYRPVPRERFSYIRNRPLPPPHHRHHHDAHPSHRHDVHHGGHHGRPVNHRPDVMPRQPQPHRSFGQSSTRVTAPRGNTGHQPGSSHSMGRRPNGGHSSGSHLRRR